MTDLLAKLEAWRNGHKARSVTLYIDNGYGASSWTVILYGQGPQVTVEESVDMGVPDPLEPDGTVAGYSFSRQDDGSLCFDVKTPKRGEWAGLHRTLEAALAIAEELKL